MIFVEKGGKRATRGLHLILAEEITQETLQKRQKMINWPGIILFPNIAWDVPITHPTDSQTWETHLFKLTNQMTHQGFPLPPHPHHTDHII